MAKSAHKRPESLGTPKKSDRSFIAVDQKSFDPGLASLFASSVRILSSATSELFDIGVIELICAIARSSAASTEVSISRYSTEGSR